MKINKEQKAQLIMLTEKHLQLQFNQRLKKEFSISHQEAMGIIYSAAVADAYLSISGKDFQALGFTKREEFIKVILRLCRVYRLKGFNKLTTARSFVRKVVAYQDRKRESAFEAMKALSFSGLKNKNSRKITEEEYRFIEEYVRQHPLTGRKRVYTALKRHFGAITVTPEAIAHCIKKVIKSL